MFKVAKLFELNYKAFFLTNHKKEATFLPGQPLFY